MRNLIRQRVNWISAGLVLAAVVVGAPRAASADQVILDDLIVDGSICAGLDCVNGESFGFDTLRLKENNLRIKFQDTSTSASFPSNDWQITINDSSNGGQNKFSIDDIDGGRTPFTIEAGAPSHSLYVDDGGRIGLGTSTPVVEVHIKDGDTPTVRLEQDGSSGFTQQVWDVAGNEANFFIRDVTNGSKLTFRIRPGAPDSSIYVDADGDVGLGTQSPQGKFHVENTGGQDTDDVVVTSAGRVGVATVSPASTLTVDGDDGNSNRGIRVVGTVPTIRFQDTDATTSFQFRANAERFEIQSNNSLFSNAASRLSLTSDGFLGLNNQIPTLPLVIGTNNTNGNGANVTLGGMFMNGSSREFKENIKDVATDEAREAVMNLKPVKYNYKLEPGEEYAGFIAEDVPELVATNNRKYLSPMDIVSVVTKVVQDQQQTIERQQEAISTLSKRLEQLEAQSPAQD